MNFSSHKINDWMSQRPWPLFWRCLPAVFASLLLLLTLAWMVVEISGENGLRLRYQRTAVGALASGDFELARVACLRGLLFTSDERTRLEWRFYLSLSLQGLGHHAEASALMATAAPIDHPGYIRAHLTVAQSLLNATNLTPEMIQLAETHLQHALILDPQSIEINELLGRYYINTSKFTKARQRLLEIYPLKNEVALLLALIENASQNAVETRVWADAAREAFQKNLKDIGPRDSQSDRLGLVHALLLEEDYAGALKTLEAGLRLQDEPAYHAAIGAVCVSWSKTLIVSPTADPAEALAAVQKGLAHAPQNFNLWLALIQISHDSGPAGHQALDLVQAQLANATGEAAAWWHFWLATDARQLNQPAKSREHLLLAYQLAPALPQIANDMAMDLAFGQPADLTRALAIIQPVVEKFPDHPGFRDTRGRILLKLGRAAEAVADLSFAASKPEPSGDTLQMLAAAYETLGQLALAAEQRQRAARLQFAPGSPTGP